METGQDGYRPMSKEETLYVHGMRADASLLSPGEIGLSFVYTPRGVIIVEIVHADYPRDLCQYQIVVKPLSINASYVVHDPAVDRRDYIPPDILHRIIDEQVPDLLSENRAFTSATNMFVKLN
jgi:hypothetical protein